ncbi:hypothetical protein LCGC14_1095240 [marine sediment metagenome]|uniref:Uncharacterized protein n=1 Tax=marine sediment metagenome TaxID=412755 RepID=A0A0F9PUA3_9ZZZZ
MNKWIATLLRQIVTQMSPAIRTALVDFVNNLDEAAQKTDNPWDDVAVGLLKLVLLIE